MYSLVLLLLAAVPPAKAQAPTIDISNPSGNIQVLAGAPKGFAVRARRESGPALAEDVQITFDPKRTRIVAIPNDGKRVDLEVDLPFGVDFSALTHHGDIRVEGLPRRAEVTSQSGAIELAAPWRATRLRVYSEKEPPSVTVPPKIKFSKSTELRNGNKVWSLQDRLNDDDLTYGFVIAQGAALSKITLTDIPYPADAPVKMHWLAPGILETLLTGPSKTPTPAGPNPETAPTTPTEEGVLLIRSDVREVALLVSVTDEKNNAVKGLKPEDFEILEENVPQTVASLDAEEIPFNLALFLDLSGSARRNRPALVAALKGFVDLARPQDRVAIYVLVDEAFIVVTRLTSDRQQIARALQRIPNISGSSPVYDTLLLSYAEELLQRPRERNAIIAITDGLDNQIDSTGVNSKVNFKKLERAAEGMHALIFPILLNPFTLLPSPSSSEKAKERMESLANRSGGRLFPAAGPQDLAPIYPQVEDTLRSVYSLTYAPKNQTFNGEWRRITVRVKKPGVKATTRTGYFAR